MQEELAAERKAKQELEDKYVEVQEQVKFILSFVSLSLGRP